MNADDIHLLIDSELAQIADPDRRERIANRFVPPEQVLLSWEYGKEGDQLACWRFGQTSDGTWWLVYCNEGFGPQHPWGFVEAESGSIGIDCQWWPTLERAAINLGLIK